MTRAAPLAVVYARGQPPSGAAPPRCAPPVWRWQRPVWRWPGAGLVVAGAWATTSGASGVANNATIRTVATRTFTGEVISICRSLWCRLSMDGLDPCACNKLRRRAWMASGSSGRFEQSGCHARIGSKEIDLPPVVMGPRAVDTCGSRHAVTCYRRPSDLPAHGVWMRRRRAASPERRRRDAPALSSSTASPTDLWASQRNSSRLSRSPAACALLHAPAARAVRGRELRQTCGISRRATQERGLIARSARSADSLIGAKMPAKTHESRGKNGAALALWSCSGRRATALASSQAHRVRRFYQPRDLDDTAGRYRG